MKYLICISILVITCSSIPQTELGYQDYLASVIKEKFYWELSQKRNIQAVLVKDEDSRFRFIIHETLNYPNLGYLPVNYTKANESFIFFYDYRYSPLNEKDIAFPLGKDSLKFNTGSKIEYVIVQRTKEGFTHRIGDLEEGMRLFENPKLFKNYESYRNK